MDAPESDPRGREIIKTINLINEYYNPGVNIEKKCDLTQLPLY